MQNSAHSQWRERHIYEQNHQSYTHAQVTYTRMSGVTL